MGLRERRGKYKIVKKSVELEKRERKRRGVAEERRERNVKDFGFYFWNGKKK